MLTSFGLNLWTFEGGVLYILRKYKMASHLCCCGCGNKGVTLLNPSGWKLFEKCGVVSLSLLKIISANSNDTISG